MSREPALILGTIATIIVLVGQQLLSNDIVTSAAGVHWVNLLVGLAPLLSAALIRLFVSPAAKPGL